MDELNKFFSWWRDDVERAKCTLEQIVGAYCASFPGRPLPLVCELMGPIARFMDKVDRSGKCWAWTGAHARHGYGHFRFGGDVMLAHRFSYQAFKGEIPEGMCVLHSCDNPPCVNPAHLKLGTPKDNAVDRDTKGRSGTRKLTPAQVVEIRSSKDTRAALARRYEVDPKTISDIMLNKRWKQ